jgi:hypothetical protein
MRISGLRSSARFQEPENHSKLSNLSINKLEWTRPVCDDTRAARASSQDQDPNDRSILMQTMGRYSDAPSVPPASAAAA